MNVFSLAQSDVFAEVTATATNLRDATMRNVAAVFMAGVAYGVKDANRRTVQDKLLDGGLTYKTANRQLNFGMAVAAKVAKACPEHARINELRAATTTSVAMMAALGFLSDMGILAAKDCETWCEGNGAPLTIEARAEARKAPAPPMAKVKEADETKAEPAAKVEAKAEATKEELRAAQHAKAEEARQQAEADAKAKATYEARVMAEAWQHAIAMVEERSEDELKAMLKAVNAALKARKAQLKIAA